MSLSLAPPVASDQTTVVPEIAGSSRRAPAAVSGLALASARPQRMICPSESQMTRSPPSAGWVCGGPPGWPRVQAAETVDGSRAPVAPECRTRQRT